MKTVDFLTAIKACKDGNRIRIAKSKIWYSYCDFEKDAARMSEVFAEWIIEEKPQVVEFDCVWNEVRELNGSRTILPKVDSMKELEKLLCMCGKKWHVVCTEILDSEEK